MLRSPWLLFSLFIAVALLSVGTMAAELCYDTPPSSCPAQFCKSPTQPELENCRRYQSRIQDAEQQISDIERLFVPVLNIAVNGAQSPANATGNVAYQLSLTDLQPAQMSSASSEGIQRSLGALELKDMSAVAQKNGIDLSDPYQALRPMEQARLDEVQDALQDLHTRNKMLLATLKSEQSACPTKNKTATGQYEAATKEMESCEAIYANCIDTWANFVEEFAAVYTLPFERSSQTCVKY